MNKSTKNFLIMACLLMATAVSLGAFGAHGLKKIITPDMLSVYQTGVQYQFYHALGLLGVAFIAHVNSTKLVNMAGNLMFTGVMIFSGSLYLLVILNIKWLGAITPIGGVLMVISWVLLAWSVFRSNE
ncbi:MAG: DUF423 domain-containing protein [Arcobacteraceae bacterium]|jgi:uncharacterized membrane protein YgdD (TMEM256/DUF423 family)|nr:DUF423 domain-containing protein [Arcobacteraceae bacterium]